MNFDILSQFGPATLAVFGTLAILSFAAVSVAFFKVFQFSRLGVGRRKEAEHILDAWLSGRVDEAAQMASARKSVLSRILQAVFTGQQARPGDAEYAEELGRQTAIIELAAMGERMRVLDMVVQAAPMLGLLGTVIGMIDAFSILSLAEGAADPTELANGIWTALTTTAVGLAIAIAAFFVSSWFEARIDRERNLIEALVSAAVHGRVDSTVKPG